MPTPQDLINRFAALPYTGAISAIFDEMGSAHQVLPSEIQSIQRGETLAGRALTVTGARSTGRVRDDYFLPFLQMLGSIAPGDVVVSQPNDHTIAHFGELSCETSKFRGGRGVVIDGGIRDIDHIFKLGFPAFVRYQTPQDIVFPLLLLKKKKKTNICGLALRWSDLMRGDPDGLVVISSGAVCVV